MTDTTAQIQAKGCQSTGITEDMAIRLHDQLGKKLIAIVELEAVTRTENSEGKQKVGLRILTVEPAVDSIGETHLRDVQRALFMNRRLDDGQPQLPGDEPEPTVKEVIENRGAAVIERDEDGEVTGLWDGDTTEDTPREPSTIGSPFTQPTDDEPDDDPSSDGDSDDEPTVDDDPEDAA